MQLRVGILKERFKIRAVKHLIFITHKTSFLGTKNVDTVAEGAYKIVLPEKG